MHIAFILTMPNNNSWNGKWSGDEKLYVRVLSVGTAKATRAKFEKLVGNHYYNFGDGWGANVQVKEVTGDEKRKLVKRSAGFCGYDWMIESLRWYGRIMNDNQRAAYLATGKQAGDWANA
jgi:hypothetical protein